jgi:hypothetical protein
LTLLRALRAGRKTREAKNYRSKNTLERVAR